MPGKDEQSQQGFENAPDVIDLTDGHIALQAALVEHNEFEKEQFTKDVLEKLLILGLAARDCNPAALILRYDRPLLDGQLVQSQAIRIDVDLILLDKPADRCDLGYARYRIELIPDEPVLQRTEFAQGPSGAFDGVPKHMAHSCGVWTECRSDARGKRLGD